MRRNSKTLIGVFFLLTVCAAACFHVFEPFRSKDRKINIIFRYDDYSAVSFTKLETAIVDIFRKNDLICSFGVVPFVCSGDVHDPGPQTRKPLVGDKAEYLKKASDDGVVEVGLHGYDHQTLRPRSQGYTEFQGLSYETQFQKIRDGKKYLEQMTGREVTTFIPPWNSYDSTTLTAAENAGFKIISGDFDGVARESSTLQFIPSTSTIGKVRQAVHRARWNPSKTEQLIVVLFHDYDFKEFDPKDGRSTIADLDKVVSWAAQQPDIRVLSLQQAGQMGHDLNAQKYMAYQGFHKIAPAMTLELLFPIGALSPDPLRPTQWWLSWSLSVLIYGGFYVACFYLVYKANTLIFKKAAFRIYPALEMLLRVTTLATFSIFVLFFLSHQSYKTLLVSAVFAGLCAGLDRTYFRHLKCEHKGVSV